MTNEDIITAYLHTAYSDARLVELFAHIEDGKFSFVSCCCLRGAANSNHALRGRMHMTAVQSELHYLRAGLLPGARDAEVALLKLLDEDLTDGHAQAIHVAVG